MSDAINHQSIVKGSADHSWRDFSLAPEMVLLPSGSFLMGGSEEDKFATSSERPRHRVEIQYGLAISRFPVTQREFDRLDPTPALQPNVPVVNVSWLQAVEYCSWLSERTGHSYRLASESEWEYACRAGSTSPFSTGEIIAIDQANFLYDEMGQKVGLGHPTAVGRYTLNCFGLGDTHGNVCEWIADCWHSDYEGAPADGSPWFEAADPGRRVIRGGAWDYLPRLLRSAWRDWLPHAARRDNLGFRVALTLDSIGIR